MIKTFRGLLADGGQDRIRLQTIKGKVGYRIVKFQIMPNNMASESQESTVKIWKKKVTSINSTINFTDSDLLAVAYVENDSSNKYYTNSLVIFDNEIMNQDIYIAHKDQETGSACNYYLELEVIPLDDVGAEYTTLKDMRQPA